MVTRGSSSAARCGWSISAVFHHNDPIRLCGRSSCAALSLRDRATARARAAWGLATWEKIAAVRRCPGAYRVLPRGQVLQRGRRGHRCRKRCCGACKPWSRLSMPTHLDRTKQPSRRMPNPTSTQNHPTSTQNHPSSAQSPELMQRVRGHRCPCFGGYGERRRSLPHRCEGRSQR